METNKEKYLELQRCIHTGIDKGWKQSYHDTFRSGNEPLPHVIRHNIYKYIMLNIKDKFSVKKPFLSQQNVDKEVETVKAKDFRFDFSDVKRVIDELVEKQSVENKNKKRLPKKRK